MKGKFKVISKDEEVYSSANAQGFADASAQVQLERMAYRGMCLQDGAKEPVQQRDEGSVSWNAGQGQCTGRVGQHSLDDDWVSQEHERCAQAHDVVISSSFYGTEMTAGKLPSLLGTAATSVRAGMPAKAGTSSNFTSSKAQDRLEVKHEGLCHSACADRSNDEEAVRVACKETSHVVSANRLARQIRCLSSAEHGCSNHACIPTEQQLAECRLAGWGVHSHRMDANKQVVAGDEHCRAHFSGIVSEL